MSSIQQAILNKARTDKFLLAINLPPALLQINKKIPKSHEINLDTLQFAVYGAVAPTLKISEQVLPYGGMSTKVSSHYREPWEDLQVGFKVDNKYNNYWVLWTWLNMINDSKTAEFDKAGLTVPSTSKNPYDKDATKSQGRLLDYAADMTLEAVDEYDNPTIRFDYVGAFPTSLNSINFDYKDTQEIDSSVSFAYSRLSVNLL